MSTEKPFGSDKEQQARHEVMGTNRVLTELARKYQLDVQAPGKTAADITPADQARLDITGGSRILEQLRERREVLIRELEQLPVRRDIYKKEELELILKTEQQLYNFIKDFDQAAAGLSKGTPEYRALCKKYIDLVISSLDQKNFWAYKFTTENSGGAADNTPLEYTDEDSLYYVTKSGISLRMKRSISELGLGAVIQPFFEKIVFGLENSRLSIEKPEIGARVTEYRSDEFRQLLANNTIPQDFESPNELFLKEGKIFFVNSNDQKPHEGDRVNEILEVR